MGFNPKILTEYGHICFIMIFIYKSEMFYA